MDNQFIATSMSHRCLLVLGVVLLASLVGCAGGPTSDFPKPGGITDPDNGNGGGGNNGGGKTDAGSNPGGTTGGETGGNSTGGGTTGGTTGFNNGGNDDAGVSMDAGSDPFDGSMPDASDGDATVGDDAMP